MMMMKSLGLFGRFGGCYAPESLMPALEELEAAFLALQTDDAFQAEFDYCDEPEMSDGKFYKSGRTWDEDEECNEFEYKRAMEKYDQKLIEFGKNYLEPLYDKEHYELML
jgi:hypothetical protein